MYLNVLYGTAGLVVASLIVIFILLIKICLLNKKLNEFTHSHEVEAKALFDAKSKRNIKENPNNYSITSAPRSS